MACSATAIGSRCRPCWPASRTRSPIRAFSISSRTRPGTPTGSGGGSWRCFPRALHRWHLPYAVGVSRHLTVFPGTPAVHVPPSGCTGRPRTQLVLVHDTRPIAVRALALALPARAWRRVTWRNGANRPWAARFAAVRVTPAHDWRDRRLAPEVWLLCEQDLGATPRTKYFFVHLPATASVTQLVRLAHQRWAIVQKYKELKTELRSDHFKRRS